jgi:hypothetical protein
VTDLQILGLVLVAVYLWECLCWIPKGTVVLVTWFGKHWRVTHPGTLAGNPRGGLFLAPPLPPLGRLVSTRQLPFSLTPQGLLAYVSSTTGPGGRPPQTGLWFSWDAVKSIEAKGKVLYVNRQRFLKTGSAPDSRRLAKMLREISAQSMTQRASTLKARLRESLDLSALHNRWQTLEKPSATLRWWTNLEFIYLFFLCPGAIGHLGLKYCWPMLLAGLLALDLIVAWKFYRAHRVLFPEDDEERFSQTLTILLAPCSAVRANDLLSRYALEQFHPLAAARHFASPDAFRHLAAHWLRELLYPARPVCPVSAPEAQTTEANARAHWLERINEFLLALGINPAELLQPPAAMDDACQQYCPRCLSQFAAGASGCSDCGGIPLAPLHPATPQAG